MHLEWIDDCLNWQGISDSLVICGALSLLMEIYNGRTREEIQELPLQHIGTSLFPGAFCTGAVKRTGIYGCKTI